MAVTLATAAVIAGTAVSAFSTLKQRSAQKRAARNQRKLQTLQRNRERRRAFREAQLARSRALVQAAAGGVSQSTGVLGGVSSLSSQLGANLGFSTQGQGLSNNISRANQSAANAQSIGQLGGQVAGIGGQLGGWQQIQGWLGGTQDTGAPDYTKRPPGIA